MSYTDRLSKLDRQYADTSDLEQLPLGRHEAEITESAVVEVPWSTDLQWKVTFTNETGQRHDHFNLERESTLFKVKQIAPKLGYDGPLSGLAKWAPVAVGAKCFVEFYESPNKNNPEKPYINTKIVKLLSGGKGEALKEEPGPAPQSDLDDIPFMPSSMDNFL